MRAFLHPLVAGVLAALFVLQTAAPEVACARCGWRPPVSVRAVAVRDTAGLERAVESARPGDTILLADGQYALTRTIDIRVPNVTIRGRSGLRERVELHGNGMTRDQVGVAFSISSAGVTLADLTVRDVAYHAIQVRGEQGASNFTLHNARILDAGQQLVKGSFAGDGRYADDALLACSEFSYTTSAPSDYTNAVGALGVKGWTVRDNRFLRIRGPESGGWRAGPTILLWAGSIDSLVERNVIVDSFRGIALGLGIGGATATRDMTMSYDHLRGAVRHNVIQNFHAWADEAIEVNAGRDARIEHNTVLVEGSIPWSIAVRYPSSSAQVRNNLTNRPVFLRDGGRAGLAGNIDGANRQWFIDAPGGDFHLVPGAARARDSGVVIADVPLDFDRLPRVAGRAPDAGAFEWRPVR